MAAFEVLSVNPSKTVHELVDDEVILIDLESGTYYSLVETAAEIWGALETGTTREQLLEALAQRYPGQDEDRDKAVLAFLDELLKLEILKVELQNAAPTHCRLSTTAKAPSQFVAPILAGHTNMSDLLLLDPIHDVDEQGWPHALPG